MRSPLPLWAWLVTGIIWAISGVVFAVDPGVFGSVAGAHAPIVLRLLALAPAVVVLGIVAVASKRS